MWPFRRKVHQIVLYGKPGCHLCDDARSLIERLAGSAPLQLREVDITSSRELFRRYDVVIPVVVVDGLIEIQAPITERALRDALRRAPGTPR
jgi:glutaredoxin